MPEGGSRSLFSVARSSRPFGGFSLYGLHGLLDLETSLDEASKGSILRHVAAVCYLESSRPSNDFVLLPAKNGVALTFEDVSYEVTPTTIVRRESGRRDSND